VKDTTTRTARAEAANNIERFARENRLVQNTWHRTAPDGREIACLLGAIHPAIDSPHACPATVMPKWLAELTVVLFDKLPRNDIHNRALAYAMSMRTWDKLGKNTWERVHRGVRAQIITFTLNFVRPIASKATCWTQVAGACTEVVRALLAQPYNQKATTHATEVVAWDAVLTAMATSATEASRTAEAAAQAIAQTATRNRVANAVEEAIRAGSWVGTGTELDGFVLVQTEMVEAFWNNMLDTINNEALR
jgi:hypothetical protein